MGLHEITASGLLFSVRGDATDGQGGNWDEKIVREVVDGDCYGLRNAKETFPNAKLFVDIGANIGAFAAFVKSLWPDATVICAEPATENVLLLKLNTAGIAGIHIVPKAVIGSPEKQVGFLASSFLSNPDGFRNPGDGKVEAGLPTMVEACMLADIVPDGEIDFLKLDCEGSEGEILESSAAMLPKTKLIRGEWHGVGMGERLAKALSQTHDFDFKGLFDESKNLLYYNIGMFHAELKGGPKDA
jgi:FkbM family methyltransferase